MTAPGDVRDLAAAYVLGVLDAGDTTAFEAQLAASADLRREVAALREVVGLLALGAPPVPRDDDALKARLMERIRATPRGGAPHAVPPPRPGVRPWVTQLGWAAAAAAAIAVGIQQWRLGALRERLVAVEHRADSVALQLARREATLDHILEPSTALILLTAPDARPPGIQLFWNRAQDSIVVHAFSLPPAPEGRAYQLWFLGEGAPVPGGTFNSEPDGHALVKLAGPPEGVTLQGAAVTEEPEGGSPAPTSAIIVVGSVGE